MMLVLDPQIVSCLERRAAFTDHTVQEIAEALLSVVLLDEE